MTKPLIQIDNQIREMTDEEYANYQAIISEMKPVPEVEVD